MVKYWLAAWLKGGPPHVSIVKAHVTPRVQEPGSLVAEWAG